MKTTVSSTLVHPSNFNLEKLEWWDTPLMSLSSCSELSVTGDTAKYLVWHSTEVVHFHHKTPSAHSDHGLLEVKRKGEDGAETVRKHFADHCRLDPFPPTSTTSACQAGPVPRNLLSQAKAHMTCGCTKSNLHLEQLQSLCSWVAFRRSEERRVGKECSEPCRSRWSPYH